jgi:spore coat protein A, manganese oxidase
VGSISRRVFVAGAVSLVGRAEDLALDPNTLEKLVDPLPILPGAKHQDKQSHFRLEMAEIHVKVHRDLPATRVWGYNGSSPGPVVEARSGESVSIERVNRLPKKHFLRIDHTLHGAEADKPEVRAVVNVHGAKTPPESDGYPEAWYVPGKSVIYRYPNSQEAGTTIMPWALTG